jgi:hypothetical protein
MNWKTILAVIAAAPFVVVLLAVGVAAYNVSQTWDARNTDALISGLVASCGMGGIVIAGLLTAIIGIPFAMRLMDKWQETDAVSRRRWRTSGVLDPTSNRLTGYFEPRPPMIDAKPEPGSWASSIDTYDLWEGEQTSQRPS